MCIIDGIYWLSICFSDANACTASAISACIEPLESLNRDHPTLLSLVPFLQSLMDTSSNIEEFCKWVYILFNAFVTTGSENNCNWNVKILSVHWLFRQWCMERLPPWNTGSPIHNWFKYCYPVYRLVCLDSPPPPPPPPPLPWVPFPCIATFYCHNMP